MQLSRYGLQTLLFEEQVLGGLLKNANLVENYPGFPGGISGRQLVNRLAAQVKGHPVKIIYKKVEQVFPPGDRQDRTFTIEAGDKQYLARVVVAACGTLPKTLSLVEELPKALRKNAFYEVFPLLPEEDKIIAIIGAGDAAFDYALNLARQNQVVILNRGSRVRALPLLVQRIHQEQKIQYRDNVAIEAIQAGQDHDLSLTLAPGKKDKILECDYLIAAVGREERRDFFSPQLLEQEQSLVNRGLLHLVGDLKNGRYRQATLAVGDGVEAAMKIYEEIGDCA